MEMIDVLKKLQEIAETKPELVKDAVESVERTNPKEVKENAVESEAPIQEFRNVVTPRDEAHYRELMKQLQDVDLDPATRSDPAMKAEVQKRRSELKNWAEQNLKTEADRQPGGMSDIHIGAQEVVGEFVDDDGNLVQPKADVLKAMAADAKQSPFPKSYEIETAMKMVDEKFEDDGSPKDEMPEPDEVMASAEPQTTETPVQEDAGDEQKWMNYAKFWKFVNEIFKDKAEEDIGDQFINATTVDEEPSYVMSKELMQRQLKKQNTPFKINIDDDLFEFSGELNGRYEEETDMAKMKQAAIEIIKTGSTQIEPVENAGTLSTYVQEDAGEDEKIVDMLRNIKQHLDNHPNMSEHPSLVALDQLADDLESGDKPADYESVQEKTIGQGLPIGTKAFLNMGSKLDINFSRDQAYMVSGVLNRLDQDALLKAVDTYKAQELDPDQAESNELNTNTMTTEDKKPINESKKPVKEAITMTADSPEEAGMLMQMLKLAGVQQVTPDMIGAEEPTADNDADHDHDGDGQQDHAPQDCNVCAGDDAIGSQGMGQVRDIVTAPDDEKAEETFANEPDEKVSDVDTLVNVHSGGLNKQKQQVRKEYPGDNPLASKYETVEDKISEEDLANSLRNQYEGFKKDYQEAAKVAEAKAKPDFLDMDKDGDKKEPMKKAIADKK